MTGTRKDFGNAQVNWNFLESRFMWINGHKKTQVIQISLISIYKQDILQLQKTLFSLLITLYHTKDMYAPLSF